MSTKIAPSLFIVSVFLVLATGCAGSATEEGDALGPSTSALATDSTDEPSDVETQPIEVATAFMKARDAYDVDTTLMLLSPDANILDFGAWPREPDEYRGLFDFWRIHNWSWEHQGCEEIATGPPTRVTCSYLIENDWTQAQSVDPVLGEHEFVVDSDGLISEVTRDFRNFREVFVQWFEWLESSHRSDIRTLYRFDEEGNLTGGPATTPEALELFRQYLPEYVEWEESQR